MKRMLALFALVLASLSVVAQELSQTTFEDKEYLVVSMDTEMQGYDNVSILLNKGTLKKFISRMKDYCEKVEKWNATAHSKKVKEYKKTMTGTIPLKKIIFNCDGLECVSDKYYDNYLVPYFHCDSEGNCSFILGGYYSGYNVRMFGKNNVTDPTSKDNYYYQYCKFPFHVSIPAEEMAMWINDIESIANGVNVKQKQLKEMDKMFN